jgi:hypothetical protein
VTGAVESRESKVESRSSRRSRTLLAVILLAVVGCGKKGDPSPPLPRGANAIKDLTVEQEGGEAVLTFTYPDRLLNGQPLTDLTSIEIYRFAGATAAMAGPRGSQPSGGAQGSLDRAPGGAARRAALSARMAEESFYREAVAVARLTVAELARRTRGATIVYRDPLLPVLSKSATPPPLGYAVVSVRGSGDKSPLSNIAIIAPDIPPGPP